TSEQRRYRAAPRTMSRRNDQCGRSQEQWLYEWRVATSAQIIGRRLLGIWGRVGETKPVADLEVSNESVDLPQRRQAQPPIETDGIQVPAPAQVAAGFKSVLKAAEVTIKEPGLMRHTTARLHLNQLMVSTVRAARGLILTMNVR